MQQASTCKAVEAVKPRCGLSAACLRRFCECGWQYTVIRGNTPPQRPPGPLETSLRARIAAMCTHSEQQDGGEQLLASVAGKLCRHVHPQFMQERATRWGRAVASKHCQHHLLEPPSLLLYLSHLSFCCYIYLICHVSDQAAASTATMHWQTRFAAIPNTCARAGNMSTHTHTLSLSLSLSLSLRCWHSQ